MLNLKSLFKILNVEFLKIIELSVGASLEITHKNICTCRSVK